MNDIDHNSIGLAFKAIDTFLKVYSAFKKNNSEKFISKILNGNFSKENVNKLLDKIYSDNSIKPQFHYIIDKVSSELIEEKIQLWANAYKNLSNDIYTNELFLKTLNNMSYLEYLVLQSYSDNPQPIDIQLKSSTLIAKNKLVAMGLLINENYIKKSKWEELNSEKEVETEYILSEFGTKMLEFLSDSENKI